MAWTTVYGPDPFNGTAYDFLEVYLPAVWNQNTTNGNIRISTNQTSAGCGSAPNMARAYLLSAPGNDQAAAFTLKGTMSSIAFAIIARFTDGDAGTSWGGTGYLALNWDGTSSRMYRLDGAGSHTQIGSSASYTPTADDVYRIECVGSQIDLLVNGSSIISASDATYGSGTVGIASFSSFDDALNGSVASFTAYQQAGGNPWYYYAQQRSRPRLPKWMRSAGGILMPEPAFLKGR